MDDSTRKVPPKVSLDGTVPFSGVMPVVGNPLLGQFHELISQSEVHWTVTYHLIRQLGAGGQSVVYLADRYGSHSATFRLALKFFTPKNYSDEQSYQQEMSRIAHVAMRIAKIQQDHLLDVQNVVAFHQIQAMVMEWVDGFDLDHMLDPRTLELVKSKVTGERFEYITNVIVAATSHRLRFQPAIGVAILRECLAGLAALHREDIVHGDLKPSNIMLKKTGNAKLIDFGSAFYLQDQPAIQTWTPRYAAAELLEGAQHSTASDLASLGYVFFEMISGVSPFHGLTNLNALVEAKKNFVHVFPDLLPKDVASNELLVELLKGLIDADPSKRFATAEAADLDERGAAPLERQMVKGNLDTEHEHDIRHLLDELGTLGAGEV
jgi:serine/threonine protein kinase